MSKIPISDSRLEESLLFRIIFPVMLLFRDTNPPIKPIIAKNAVVFFVLKKFSFFALFIIFFRIFDLNIFILQRVYMLILLMLLRRGKPKG